MNSNFLHQTRYQEPRIVKDWYEIFNSSEETLDDFNKRLYRHYILSRNWRDRHKKWLNKCQSKCAFLGIPIDKKVVTPVSYFVWILEGRKGKPEKKRIGYNMHHTHYTGMFMCREKYLLDVIPLSPFAHWFVHQCLGGHIKASKQPWGRYPNVAQKLFHAYCRIPLKLESFMVASAILVSIFLA